MQQAEATNENKQTHRSLQQTKKHQRPSGPIKTNNVIWETSIDTFVRRGHGTVSKVPPFLINHENKYIRKNNGSENGPETTGKYDTTCVELRVKLRVNSQNGNKYNNLGIK